MTVRVPAGTGSAAQAGCELKAPGSCTMMTRRCGRRMRGPRRYKAKFGQDQVTNAVMECAYNQTFLLAQGIEKAQSTEADALIFEGIPGQVFENAPGGRIKMNEKNHHAWLWPRIGQAKEDGLLYPDKDCDFTDPRVLDRLKSGSSDRSGTIQL